MPSISDNPFIGLTLIVLQDLQSKYVTGIGEIATTGQSYQINNRSFTAADLESMKATLQQINQAIDRLSSTRRKTIAQGFIR